MKEPEPHKKGQSSDGLALRCSTDPLIQPGQKEKITNSTIHQSPPNLSIWRYTHLLCTMPSGVLAVNPEETSHYADLPINLSNFLLVPVIVELVAVRRSRNHMKNPEDS
ncbi:hypothetical protein ILYODFUR_037813 [Ilyodon furcidens]|uniref:Uncharacterized protein n=1 Tax=Ilyodon furcidens TaxID=33524 RepID=A0ABV0V9G2_9TELE